MSIKFLYATDLHGDQDKYQIVLKTALKLNIKTIHLGADILPKGINLIQIQKEFVNNFLKKFLDECRNNGIKILLFFGNDDLYLFKNKVRKNCPLLDESPVTIDGYEFKAYGYVPDYPFALKTACKFEYPGEPLNTLFNRRAVCVNKRGLYNVRDIQKYFESKGSIQQDLQQLDGNSNTIMAFHCPPDRLDLDVCGTCFGRGFWFPRNKVGSPSIREWIAKHKPKIVLCGHIHESPIVTGTWKAWFGNTLVIQPGQMDRETTMVTVEIKDHVQCDLIQERAGYYEKIFDMALKKEVVKT